MLDLVDETNFCAYAENGEKIALKLSVQQLDRSIHYRFNYNYLEKATILEFNNYGKIEKYNINNIFNFNQNGVLASDFKDKRVIITMSRDNKFEWIKDFCQFYKDVHKADMLLIYDNCSENYTSKELKEYLKVNVKLDVVVVRWPIPYGPGAYNGSYWDSDYSQYVMFEHAKYNFLRYAKSVLNVDIDELVIPLNGKSIFEESENLNSQIFFDGFWVESDKMEENISYKNLLYINEKSQRTASKWCASMQGISNNMQFRVHDIFNLESKQSLRYNMSANYEMRHFKAINTGWKYKSRLERIQELEGFRECEYLKDIYKKLGWV